MIKLTCIDGRALFLSPQAVTQVKEAGASQAWHGVRSNVQTLDGEWHEVLETPAVIAAAIGVQRGQ
jgi:hypothetical protein